MGMGVLFPSSALDRASDNAPMQLQGVDHLHVHSTTHRSPAKPPRIITKRPFATMPRVRCVAMMSLSMLNVTLSCAASPAGQRIVDGCIAPAPNPSDPITPLALARELNAPPAADTKGAEYEHDSFWENHGPLLRDAWEEWEERTMQTGFPSVIDGGGDGDFDELIDPALTMALDDAFGSPSDVTEAAVKSLLSDSDDDRRPLPGGVYAVRLIEPSGISRIRNVLDAAASSGIPARRPNGMNRRGVVVDPDVRGAVPVKSLVRLVEESLVRRVVRPIGRMLFPDRVGCGDDAEYFAFTIRYDGGEGGVENGDSKRDFELKEHRDASIVTLNVNLNLPEEGYAGSGVYFREFPSNEHAGIADEDERGSSHSEGNGRTVRFSPGMAIIHLGAHRHGSLPILPSTGEYNGGKRCNLVIWLFGRGGDVRIAPYKQKEQMNVVERWRGCNNTEGYSFD